MKSKDLVEVRDWHIPRDMVMHKFPDGIYIRECQGVILEMSDKPIAPLMDESQIESAGADGDEVIENGRVLDKV